MVGIVSYGTYIPKYRIKLNDIAGVWKKDAGEVIGSLGLSEKSVPGIDEDAATIAFEAAAGCLEGFAGQLSDIGVLLVGSESHPYAVNPTSTIVGELIGIGSNYLASDLEFACKAGTAGMQLIAGMIDANQIKFGLAIGADAAQSKTHDALEYTSAAAGAAFLLGKSKVLASLKSYTSVSSDTPDFWRRDGIRYPSHAGRFTGEPAYFSHVMAATRKLMEQAKVTPKEIDYCVFHMPNGKFPQSAAKRLGFSREQLEPSLTVKLIGNPYTASSLLGLAAVLDIARPGQKILMTSYGSGAGSDAFLFETTENIIHGSQLTVDGKKTVKDQIENKVYIDYAQYLKQTHKI